MTKAQADLLNAQTRAAESTAKLAKSQEAATQAAQNTARAEQEQSAANSSLTESMRLVIQNMGRVDAEQIRLAQHLYENATATRSLASEQTRGAESAGELAESVNHAAAAYERLSTAQGAASSASAAWSFQTSGLSTYTASPQRTIIYDVPNWAESSNYSNVGIPASAWAGGGVSGDWSGAARGAEQVADAVRNMDGAMSGAGASAIKLFNNVWKFAQWYVISGVVSGVFRAFNDGIDTLKAVDDQMVVVRKVTGMTGDDLAKLEKQAYKTATAYGMATDAYLESVAAFSRAGYQDQSAALAELSVKTQIVGDTTAETANQFLLSADKTYQYEGSIEKLTAVLDGANEIDNKYATSIENIAEGLGKVAPVAAQMHVGVDELSAAIGTITAVTQRTGTEAATALRALILNP